jgi:tRNA 2-selenouridine synthase
VEEYGQQPRTELENSFRKITRKIGGQYLNQALLALKEERLDEAAGIALRYYDKAYAQSLAARHPQGGMRVEWAEHEEADRVAIRLLKIIKSKNK